MLNRLNGCVNIECVFLASCFGALQVIVAIISFLETMLLMYLSYKVRHTPTQHRHTNFVHFGMLTKHSLHN